MTSWSKIGSALLLTSIMTQSYGLTEQQQYQAPSLTPFPYVPGNLYLRMAGALVGMPRINSQNAYNPNDAASDSFDSYQRYQQGYGAQASLGYRLGVVRTELEFAVLSNQQSANVNQSTGSANFVLGYVHGFYTMANLYYDFSLPSAIKPYVGAGFGYMRRDYRTQTDANAVNDYSGTVRDYAGQAIAGGAYKVSKRVALMADLRYLVAPSDTINMANKTGSATLKVTNKYSAYFGTFGVKIDLG
jgi:opacity protein-like surface antigen